jgi:hypothetical protein
VILLLACTGPKDDSASPPVDAGALGDGPLNPFPSMELVDDDLVAIPEGILPQVEGGTALDVGRFNWREGFSRVQTSVAMLPGPVDPESLPGQSAIGTGGSVQLWDLDAGVEIPMFAELDAHPDAIDAGERALLVRPMLPMQPGHRVAVALTPAVTMDGAPLALDAWDAARAADPHYQALADELADLGVDVALAWDFPVGDGTLALRSIVAERGAPGAVTIDRTWDTDAGDELPTGLWRKLRGTFTADNWLVDDEVFEATAGVPALQGTAEVELWVYVPESLRKAAPGTAPVLVFGHGILSDPDDYLGDSDDPSAVIDVANRLGVVVVATVWRGLTTDDLADTVIVAADFGQFPQVTDRLTQAVANNLSLIELVEGGTLLERPELSMADPGTILWYGISLGSIEGAVTIANQDTIGRAVFNVGGADWSTMLERSSNWPTFELQVERGIGDPWDRQILYATSQMLWDPVDPASYVEDLADRSVVWQESIGDEQVPNLTTELLMRGVGATLGTPSVTTPLDIPTAATPLAGPAIMQFDPEVGLPEETNRPAEVSGAHGAIRLFEGCRQQTLTFLTEGVVEHYCGSEPCSASNPGE